MRTITVMMQTTLDNRIARSAGVFWEPFAFGDSEQQDTNQWWEGADTWVMGRGLYDAVAPWWEMVARGEVPDDLPEISAPTREFGAIYSGLEKIVVSRTLRSTAERTVISGDIAGRLEELKAKPGKRIVLSGGPKLVGQLLDVSGLIDELLLVVHPTVISSGPRLFDDIDVSLQLLEMTRFEAGSVLLRYRVLA